MMIAIVGLSVAGVVAGVTIAATSGGSTLTPAAVAGAAPTNQGAGSAAPSTNPPATPNPGTTSPTGPNAVTLRTATVTVGGTPETILVNGSGLPLYFYKADTATTSMVSGELAALWPPLLGSTPTANGAPGTLSTISTANGRQVTYNGHFLYTFVEDSPGRVTGQGVQNFYVATPGISAIRPATSGTATTGPAPVGGGYGY
jgi:predicted lipoprotein with Yx(FWY)xxD motif